ncbi:hypothetical protein G7Y79_00049g085220 [Physcia stellaris]|nr:hypothetical protein G7Y79_00049g085220 [Physcia stellaris]
MKQLSYLSLLALITMKALALPSDPRGQEILAEGQNRRLSHVTSSEFDILVSIGLREPVHAQCMERFQDCKPGNLIFDCCWHGYPFCTRCPGDSGTAPMCHSADCGGDYTEMKALGIPTKDDK